MLNERVFFSNIAHDASRPDQVDINQTTKIQETSDRNIIVIPLDNLRSLRPVSSENHGILVSIIIYLRLEDK